jgi:hypothetical protein
MEKLFAKILGNIKKINGRQTSKKLLSLLLLCFLPFLTPFMKELKFPKLDSPDLHFPSFSIPALLSIYIPNIPSMDFFITSSLSKENNKDEYCNEDFIESLKSELRQLRNEIEELRRNPLSSETVTDKLQEMIYTTLEDKVNQLFFIIYKIYFKTGMADYALESAGAEIMDKWTTPGIPTGNALMKIWNLPIFYQTMSPRLALQPNVHPGNCFAFSGNSGFLTVKLARPIYPTNFTIEHIPKVQLDFNLKFLSR